MRLGRDIYECTVSKTKQIFENIWTKGFILFFLGSPASSSSSVVNSQTSPMHIHTIQPKQSTLHSLLMRKDKFESSPDRSLLGKIDGPASTGISINQNCLKFIVLEFQESAIKPQTT